jgi:hypothetical protein
MTPRCHVIPKMAISHPAFDQPRNRNRFNQAVFKELKVCEEGVTAYTYTEGMELLLEDGPRVVKGHQLRGANDPPTPP